MPAIRTPLCCFLLAANFAFFLSSGSVAEVKTFYAKTTSRGEIFTPRTSTTRP